MSAPPSRTITVNDYAPATYGPLREIPVWNWSPKQPDDELDYTLDVSGPLGEEGDWITSIAASMKPSNLPGAIAASASYTAALFGWPINSSITAALPFEARPVSVHALNNVITLWIGNGVPGRNSTVRLLVTTAQGRTHDFLVGIETAATLRRGPLLPAPSPYFSVPAFWRLPTMNFTAPGNSQYLSPAL